MKQREIVGELHELLNSRSNDAVKLAYLSQEDAEKIDRLDLRSLVELKRSERGAVEVKLMDRLRVIELLERLEREDQLKEQMERLTGGAMEDEGQ